MDWKLSRPQANHLLNFFDQIIEADQPLNVTDQIVLALIKQVFTKLKNKVENGEPKKSYTVKLTIAETMAFYKYFSGSNVGAGWVLESSLIQSLINLIDHKHGTSLNLRGTSKPRVQPATTVIKI